MHLSNDDLLAAIENPTLRVEHLEVCDACRARVQELREILAEARGVDIPEPSPLFWDHFSERVRASVAEEPEKAPSWNRWGWAWPAGVVAALAVVIIAVAITRSQDGSAGAESAAASVNDLPSLMPPADDPSWVFMTDLAGDLDWDDAGAAGLVARPGSAERALENLSVAERQALVDVLQQELGDRATSSI